MNNPFINYCNPLYTLNLNPIPISTPYAFDDITRLKMNLLSNNLVLNKADLIRSKKQTEAPKDTVDRKSGVDSLSNNNILCDSNLATNQNLLNRTRDRHVKNNKHVYVHQITNKVKNKLQTKDVRINDYYRSLIRSTKGLLLQRILEDRNSEAFPEMEIIGKLFNFLLYRSLSWSVKRRGI